MNETCIGAGLVVGLVWMRTSKDPVAWAIQGLVFVRAAGFALREAWLGARARVESRWGECMDQARNF
jgi:hypothetical protein